MRTALPLPRPILRHGAEFLIGIAVVAQLLGALTMFEAQGSFPAIHRPRLNMAQTLPARPELEAAPSIPSTQLPAAEWEQINRLMRTAEYQATPRIGDDGKTAFWAPNRINNLSLSFGPAGLEVAPSQSDASWSLSLRAAAYGPAGMAQPLAGEPALLADGQRVEYRWPALTEWYVNSAAGLKHNLTLEQPIAADQLLVELALGGSLRPQISADSQSISFIDGAGATVLNFGPLYIYDATGRALEARFDAPVPTGATTTLPIQIAAQGATFPITVDPLLTSPKPKITANDPEAGALFGQQVVIDGDVLVVGAPSKDERGQDSGAVYVFTRNRSGADTWGQVRKLVAADGAAGDGFGRSLALDNDILVVGAPLANLHTEDDGAVYVFDRSKSGPDSWGQVQKLDISANVVGNNFGAAVAISGDIIAVGAPIDDISVVDAGAVYTFVHRQVTGAGRIWDFERGILPSEKLTPGAGFGRALALQDSLLVVGAPNQGPSTNSTGAAYLFQHTYDAGGIWTQLRKLAGSDSKSLDGFGSAVAIAGDTIAVGAIKHDVNGKADQGAAYLFKRNRGGADSWGQEAKLIDNRGAAGDFFGSALDMDGATLAVGAPFDDDETHGLSNSGSLSVFVDGRFVTKLLGADGAASDSFGIAVAVGGDMIAAGARRHDSGAADAGAVYLFSLASEIWTEVRRHEGSGACCIGQSIALDGDTLVAGEKIGSDAQIYIFRRNTLGTNKWGEVKRFSMPTEPTGTSISLALDGDQLAVLGERSVQIFERNQGGLDTWGQQRQIFIESSQGAQLALEGDTLIVGEPAALSQLGAIEVFKRDHTGRNRWGRSQPIAASEFTADTPILSGFGARVALDGNVLVVMSITPPRFNVPVPGPTAAYIFQRETGGAGWQFVRTLQPSQPSLPSQIAVDGDTIAVSMRPALDLVNPLRPTAVSLLRRNQGGANAWGEIKRLDVPPEAAGFGSALALDGDTLAVGAPLTDLPAGPTGAVYLFERNIGGAEKWGLLATLGGSASAKANELGMAVALDGNSLAAGAGRALYIYNNSLRKPTGLGLRAETRAVQPGQPATVVASISAEDAGGEASDMPQGQVAFFLNGMLLGAGQLDTQGAASISVPGLPKGVYEITASFDGSTSWAPCQAPALKLFVGVEPPAQVPDGLTVFLPLAQR